LGTTSEDIAKFKRDGLKAGVQLAHCPTFETELSQLTPDQKAAAESACASVAGDEDVDNVVPGMVFVVNVGILDVFPVPISC
jgi:hypothetical protein